MANIIVATDSRGRHLPSYTYTGSIHSTTPIIILGATIEHIQHHFTFSTNLFNTTAHFNYSLSWHLQYHCKKSPSGCTEISYNHLQETIEKLIQRLSDSFNIGTATLRITPIPPSSLTKSRTHHKQTCRLRQTIFTENGINDGQHQQFQQDI